MIVSVHVCDVIVYEAYLENIPPCAMQNRDIYKRRYKKHCTQDNGATLRCP